MIASTISDILWTDPAEPQRIRGNFGTPNTFQVMLAAISVKLPFSQSAWLGFIVGASVAQHARTIGLRGGYQ